MTHHLTRRWGGSTPDTKTEWGTIMKHCAIKGVPDRLSGVWWASVSLQSSRAPQLINHQGGAWGVWSLKPFITMLREWQSPTQFHVLLFPPPAPTFDSQISVHSLLGKHWMESMVYTECNQIKCEKKKIKKKLLVLHEVYSSRLISFKNHELIGKTWWEKIEWGSIAF